LNEIDQIFHKINDYEDSKNANLTVTNSSAQTNVSKQNDELDRIFKKIDDFKSNSSFDASSASADKAIQ